MSDTTRATTAASAFDMPDPAADEVRADEVRENYLTTQAAAERLGVTTWTVESKCRAYRKRLEGIAREQTREPSPAERQPQLPKEMECLWFGRGKGRMLYLVKRSGLDAYPINRPDPVTGKLRRGRPAGSGRGATLQRRKPRAEDRRYRENRDQPAKAS